MHVLLENYLADVAAQLAVLPIKQRNEELREMRAHLENAVVVRRELGQSEEDAAANAVAQFGTAEDLGESVVWAWRRKQTLDKRSLWGAALCTFALLFLTEFSEGPFIRAYFNLVRTAHLPNPQHALLDYELFGLLVAGTITGSFFSKKVIAGSAFGVVIYSVVSLCLYIQWLIQPDHLQYLKPFSPVTIALRFLAPLVIKGLATLTTAWISSRFRQTCGKRRRRVSV